MRVKGFVPKKVAEILRLHEEGYSSKEISQKTEMSLNFVEDIIKNKSFYKRKLEILKWENQAKSADYWGEITFVLPQRDIDLFLKIYERFYEKLKCSEEYVFLKMLDLFAKESGWQKL